VIFLDFVENKATQMNYPILNTQINTKCIIKKTKFSRK